MSNQPLSSPVVSDSLGKLYNKDAILESLISSSSDSAEQKAEDDRIGSLRDVVEVLFSSEEDTERTSGRQLPSSKWLCPITNKTLGPGVKAVYLVPCGHAFSESAVKEISGDVCLQVHSPRCHEGAAGLLTTSSVTNPMTLTTSLQYYLSRARKRIA